MTERVLVAVDDSPDGLAAARVAIGWAARLGGSVRLVHVVTDSHLTATRQATTGPDLTARRSAAATALLRHLGALASAVGVEVEPVELHGRPAQQILHAARTWPADLVVIGRGLERGVGGPYVGGETRMVLELAEQPVLVVPAPAPGSGPDLGPLAPGAEGPPQVVPHDPGGGPEERGASSLDGRGEVDPRAPTRPTENR